VWRLNFVVKSIFRLQRLSSGFSKKKIIEYKMCVLFSLKILSETFLIIRITERRYDKKYSKSSLG